MNRASVIRRVGMPAVTECLRAILANQEVLGDPDTRHCFFVSINFWICSSALVVKDLKDPLMYEADAKRREADEGHGKQVTVFFILEAQFTKSNQPSLCKYKASSKKLRHELCHCDIMNIFHVLEKNALCELISAFSQC